MQNLNKGGRMLNWTLSLPLWLLIGVGVIIYINIGYAITSSYIKAAKNFVQEKRFWVKLLATPHNAWKYPSSRIVGDSSDSSPINWFENEKNYVIFGTLVWPIGFIWRLIMVTIYCIYTIIAFCAVSLFSLVTRFILSSFVLIPYRIFAWILSLFVIPRTIERLRNAFPAFQEWQARRAEEKRVAKEEIQAKGKKLSKEEELRKLKREKINRGQEFLALEDTIARLEAEIELKDGTPFRGSVPQGKPVKKIA